MKNFFTAIDKSFNGFVVNFLIGGILLLICAVFVVWVDFFVELVIGLALLMAAWICFYAAYKLYYFKKHIKDLMPRI